MMSSNFAANVTEDELKEGLKWELSLDRSDLRSHAWFHGNATRQACEDLLKSDGEFLVRESSTRPGDYVLSCRWRNVFLHFVVNKAVIQPYTVYERIQYTFEGDGFETIPDLVTYYVGHRQIISKASGTIISKPVNRTKPLTVKFRTQCSVTNLSNSNHSLSLANASLRRALNKASGRVTPVSSKPSTRPASILSLGSISLSSDDGHSSKQKQLESSTDYATYTVDETSLTKSSEDSAFSSFSDFSGNEFYDSPRTSFVNAENSHSGSDLGSSLEQYDFPRHFNAKVNQYRPEDDYECIPEYDTPRVLCPCSSPSIAQKSEEGGSGRSSVLAEYDTPKNIPVRRPSQIVFQSNEPTVPYDSPRIAQKPLGLTLRSPVELLRKRIEVPKSTLIKPQEFFTFLLSKDNKPLEQSALNKVHSVLRTTSARSLAAHLTQIDLDMLGLLSSELPFGLDSTPSRLELIILPEASRFRKDLLERSKCLKYFVAVSILTVQSEKDRLELLAKWIQIAYEAKTGLGNLQSFSSIVAGISSPPIARLESVWLALRTRYTTEALNYDSKLRPVLNGMLENRKNHEPPNTCYPFIDVVVRGIYEHEELLERQSRGETIDQSSESSVDLLRAFLQEGAQITSNVQMYKRNGRMVLESMALEDILTDVFRPEFHRRLLWGFKGSVVESNERFVKLDKVLELMSQRSVT